MINENAPEGEEIDKKIFEKFFKNIFLGMKKFWKNFNQDHFWL